MTHHSQVVLHVPVPCLGNRTHYGKQQIHCSGDWLFLFPQTLSGFTLIPTTVAIFGDGVSKKVMTFKWDQDCRLLVQFDYWPYKKTYKKSLPAHHPSFFFLHVRMNDECNHVQNKQRSCPDTKLVRTSILDFLASRKMRNKFLFFKPVA